MKSSLHRPTNTRWLGVLLLPLFVAAACSGHPTSSTTPNAEERPSAPSITRSPMAFPGLPPVGAKPSVPVTGAFALRYQGPDGHGSYMDLSVYPDGRMIWQRWSTFVWSPSAQPLVIPHGASRPETAYVWQRLTPDGVNRLRSTILSAILPSGLAHVRLVQVTALNYSVAVRTGGRLVGFDSGPWGDKRPTRAQLLAIHAVGRKMGDPASWLPRSDWADTRIRAFVPACYWAANERGGLDLAKLPPAASAELSKHLRNAFGIMTTADARILLQALAGSYTPSHETANEIGFMVPPEEPGLVKHTYLHISPALPDDASCVGSG